MRPAVRLAWFAGSLAVAFGFIALWQVIANLQLISPVFLPGPDRAWAALVGGFRDGDLLGQTLSTIERMVYGWLLASLLGIVLGVLIGSSQSARAYLGPSLEFVRPLPASAVAPVAISFLGLSNTMVIAVIAFGSLWPMLLATIHGFAAVEPRLIEVTRALRMSRTAVIWKVALPSALPDILAGMRFGLTVSLILAVVGEMLASQQGLGQMVLFAARAFNSADIFAGVMLLGAIGFVSNALLGVIEQRMLRWRRR
jgi:ABC-type nitrate/sulfonate/bicarbonate transport system permease component